MSFGPQSADRSTSLPLTPSPSGHAGDAGGLSAPADGAGGGALPSPFEKEIEFLCHLLGPYVNELARDSEGALDLGRIRAKNFEDFRAFLTDQASIGDGIFFSAIRSNYARTLGRDQYQPLLKLLYAAIDPAFTSGFAGCDAPKIQGLIRTLAADVIEVDAETFAQRHLSTEIGRAYLGEVIRQLRTSDAKAFLAARGGLARGIAHAAKEAADESVVEAVTDAVSWSDAYLGTPDKQEVTTAELSALILIDQVDARETEIASRRESYRADALVQDETVQAELGRNCPESLFGYQRRKLFLREIDGIIAVRERGKADVSAAAQFAAKLADLWLWAADAKNWTDLDADEEEIVALRRHIMKRSSGLMGWAQGIRTESDAQQFLEMLHHFLREANDVNGPSFWNWAADIIVGTSIVDEVSDMPSLKRKPLDEMVRLLDEYEAAASMGRIALQSQASSVQGGDELAVHRRAIIQALESVDRSIQYGYKQHKAISRAASNVASWFGGGDITDIEGASAVVDALVARLSTCSTKEAMAAIIDDLFRELSPDGKIRDALVAAENDGIEASLGMLQTILEIVIPSLIPGGQAAAATKIRTLAQLLRGLGASARVAGVASRMAGGFAMGVYVATAENTVSVASGEVRQPGQDTALAWAKDAIATGTSMMLIGALPERVGFHQALLRNTFNRYTLDRFSAASNLLKDAVVEVGEEVIDQQTRQALDGKFSLMGKNDLWNTFAVSMAGGGIKVDLVRQMISGRTPIEPHHPGSAAVPARSPQIRSETTPSTADAETPPADGTETAAPPPDVAPPSPPTEEAVAPVAADEDDVPIDIAQAQGLLTGFLLDAPDAIEIARLISDIRDLFKKSGMKEGSISLREVVRIREYLKILGDADSRARSIASALWLVLGARLAKDGAEGRLREAVIKRIEEVRLDGIEPEALKAALERAIDPKPRLIDTEIDVIEGVNPEAEILEQASRRDPLLTHLDGGALIDFKATIWSRLSRAERRMFLREIPARPNAELVLRVLAGSDALSSDEFSQYLRALTDWISRGSRHNPTEIFRIILSNPHFDEVQLRQALEAFPGRALPGELLEALLGNPQMETDALVRLAQGVQRQRTESVSPVLRFFAGVLGRAGLSQRQRFRLYRKMLSQAETAHHFLEASALILASPYGLEARQMVERAQLERRISFGLAGRASEFFPVALAMRQDATEAEFVEALEAMRRPSSETDAEERAARDDARASALTLLADHPLFGAKHFGEIVALVEMLPEEARFPAYASLLGTPRLAQEQIQLIWERLATSGAAPEKKLPLLRKMLEHPSTPQGIVDSALGLAPSEAGSFGALLMDRLPYYDDTLSVVAAALRMHPRVTGAHLESTVRVIRESRSDLGRQEHNIRSLLLAAAENPALRGFFGERYAKLRPDVDRVFELETDQAIRFSAFKGDDTGLEANAAALARRLHANDPRIDPEPVMRHAPHFDQTLATPHMLTNRVLQALAISRFALISGEPASGKSEVGRYIAAALGWGLEIFNCHRYVSEEDFLQRIGVVADGGGGFAISDGPLATALMEGKLFLLNEINLARPGALSFLFTILADVGEEFDHYNPTTGKTERRKIHPNFRMIATQNPYGPGRKPVSAALANRAVEISAQTYSIQEQAAILRAHHPELEARFGSGITDNLARLSWEIAFKTAARMIGAHSEGYSWNLRHLMRFADGFASHEGPLDAAAVLNIIDSTLGATLLPADRAVHYWDTVRNYTYGGITITEADVKAHLARRGSMKLGSVLERYGVPAERTAALAAESGVRDIPTSARALDTMLFALKQGFHPWLKGPAGTGKTKLARFAAKVLGAQVFDDTLTPQTDGAKLKGEMKPVIQRLADGSERLGFLHVPAPLVNALRASLATEDLVACILDEGAFARPDVIEELNSLIDRDGGIWVASADGKGMEFLKAGKGFRLIVASNTYGYHGVQLQSDAFRSRMHEIFLDFDFGKEELATLLSSPAIGGKLAGEIGEALLAIRDLFVRHGLPEARVSLREVARIREYVDAFAPEMGQARAVENAMWLTLGASLSEEEIAGTLGQELIKAIQKVDIPGKTTWFDRLVLRKPAVDDADARDLRAGIAVLGARLVAHNPALAVPDAIVPDPHFDHTFQTSQRLLTRAAQALAINRFALISGPPASGKSEVGRFLAQQFGWRTEIFNCHRFTTEDELLQRMGVIANGDTHFTITEGPLARALVEGKLFILNEINLAKPGALAFLFRVLADVDTEFDYYNPATGKTEKRKIHQNFRMIATRNPTGPGRHELNAALANRAIEIHAPRYTDGELTTLVAHNYPDLRARYGDAIAEQSVRLFRTLADDFAEGSHVEGYAWNLRHLLRIAEAFRRMTPDTPAGALRAIFEAVGTTLTPADRAAFFEKLKGFSIDGLRITDGDVEAFKRSLREVTMDDVLSEAGIDVARGRAIATEEGIADIPTGNRSLRSILWSLGSGLHPWLKGPAGTGKTKLARAAAKLLGAKLFEDTLTPQTDEGRLKGEVKPITITLPDGAKKIGFAHVPAALVQAIRASQREKEMVVCILDEGGFARPDVLEELNSLLDRDGGIWVVGEGGREMEFLRPGEGFRLVMASNTYGYQGVQIQSEAFRSRTHEVFMDFEYDAAEIAKIIESPAIGTPEATAVGQLLLDVRNLFISRGISEARVSLREAMRIRRYLDVFGELLGHEEAFASALWLTLGAAIPRSESALATELAAKIRSAPWPGMDRAKFERALERAMEPIPAHIAEGATRLEDEAALLAHALQAHDASIHNGGLAPDPDFDFTFPTAHRLLKRTIEALSINRFVVVSGPPASGKSEVGRFLARAFDWGHEVMNAHRETTEEEMMQRIGVIANGGTHFTITDGPLARALIEGKLFILNEVNLAKPGNLSFLFKILADIDQEFDYYNPATGRTERRRIHPNFRLVATQNPEGPGRRAMNAALANRAIEISADAYTAAERTQILTRRFERLGRRSADLPAQIVALFDKVAGAIGEGRHSDGYIWNLRQLMRLADGFDRFSGELTPEAAVGIVFDAIGTGLLPHDRASFFAHLKDAQVGGVTLTQQAIVAFIHRRETATLSDVFAAMGVDEVAGRAAARASGVLDLPTAARFVLPIAESLWAGYHQWLKGPAGTGKTKLARFAAKLLGAHIFDDTLTPQTDAARLKGEVKPVEFTDPASGERRMGFQHVPAPLVSALRASMKGSGFVACILDEGAFARPDVLEELNTLLDRDGGIWVLSEDGTRMEFLHRGDGFRLIFASNTYGDEGVQQQSEAFRSRMHEHTLDFEYADEEIAALLMDDDTRSADLAAAAAALPRTPFPGRRAAPVRTSWASPAPEVRLDEEVDGAKLAREIAAGFKAVGYDGEMEQLDPAIKRSLALFPFIDRVHMLTPETIRTKLGEAEVKKAYTDEEVGRMADRFNGLHDRLRAMAAVVGRDINMQLEFDPSEEMPAMSTTRPRVFTLDPESLLRWNADELLFISMHEGAEADITRAVSPVFWMAERPELNLFYNALNDMRVNRRVTRRLPGRTADYRGFTQGIFEGVYKRLRTQKGQMLPHEAFLYALLSRENGQATPYDSDPVVGPALRETATAIERALELIPPEDDPDEATVRAYAKAFDRVLIHEVLPAYEDLVLRSEEMLGRARKKPGDAQQSRRALRKRAEETSRDAHGRELGPQGEGGKKKVRGDFGKKQQSPDGNQQEEGHAGEKPEAGQKGQPRPGEGEEASQEGAGEGTKEGPRGAQESGKGGQQGKQGGQQGQEGGEQAEGTPTSGTTGSEQDGEKGGGSTGPHEKPDIDDALDRAIDGAGKDTGADEGDLADGRPDIGERPDGVGLGGRRTKPDERPRGSWLDDLKQMKRDEARQEKMVSDRRYSAFLRTLGRLPDRVFQVFDQLLKPNDDFEFEGYFTSGPKIDIERAIKAIHGLLPNLKVFKRKTEPVAYDYRFSLDLDVSGSIFMEWSRTLGVFGLAALFMDVFERLEIPYSINGYDDGFHPYKGFDGKLKTSDARDRIFDRIFGGQVGGSTDIRGAIVRQLALVREARKKDPRDVEFVFVLTDGDENISGSEKTITELCQEAAKEGIIVVGIGIGRGMETVREKFPVHLVARDPENLPRLLAEFIRQFASSIREY